MHISQAISVCREYENIIYMYNQCSHSILVREVFLFTHVFRHFSNTFHSLYMHNSYAILVLENLVLCLQRNHAVFWWPHPKLWYSFQCLLVMTFQIRCYPHRQQLQREGSRSSYAVALLWLQAETMILEKLLTNTTWQSKG